jgi:hypothetical protein
MTAGSTSFMRSFAAFGTICSIILVIRAWRADKAQAKTKAPQTPASQ